MAHAIRTPIPIMKTEEERREERYNRIHRNHHRTSVGDPTQQFYNIIEESAYYIRINACEDITKLSDHFISHQKLMDEYKASPYYPAPTYQNYYKVGPIRVLMDEWAAMVKPNAGCTSLMTPEIKACLRSVGSYICNDNSPSGYYVMGDRIYNQENMDKLADARQKREEEERKKYWDDVKKRPYERTQEVVWDDWINLVDYVQGRVFEKFKAEVRFDKSSYRETLSVLQKLVHYNELRSHIKKHHNPKRYKQDIVFMTKLWYGERPNPFIRHTT